MDPPPGWYWDISDGFACDFRLDLLELPKRRRRPESVAFRGLCNVGEIRRESERVVQQWQAEMHRRSVRNMVWERLR